MGRIEQDVELLVEDLGFELISFERAGGRRRPLVRVRIDVPGGSPGRSAVTVEDCARVSRQLAR
jgi:ribosome maturation factor RimP